jgi:hypothetical protein
MNAYAYILFILLLIPQQEIKYPYKNGKPTSRGIDYYVRVNKYKILSEFQKFINDSIFLNVGISTDNLSNYTDYDSLDLGYHFTYPDGSDEIIIDNQEKYVAYDINELSKFKKLNLFTHNAFVKTAVIHEFGHTYFLQIILQTEIDSLQVYKEYGYRIRSKVKMYPNPEEEYGAEFISEGVSQYIVQKMKQQIQNKQFIPKTIEDLMNRSNRYDVKYSYSVQFLKNFLDNIGLKYGIRMLIMNKPPTYQEILNPKLFYNRLNLKFGNEKIF